MHQILSLFTGAGGLDQAFESTGAFVTRAAVEYQPEFRGTLLQNQEDLGVLPHAHILGADIHKVASDGSWSTLFPWGRPSGIIAGPPCESFSVMGKHGGRKDRRGQLVFAFAEAVASLGPRFFVMENVPHLLKIEKGAVIRDLLRSFQNSGYTVAYEVLSAASYGAPTVRKRLFVIGIRGQRWSFPEPTHFQNSTNGNRWVSVREAFSGLPTPGFERPGEPQWHVAVRHTERVKIRFATVEPGSVDPIRKRSRLTWDAPSPSLMAGDLTGTRFHIHPGEHRELTNREAARLHGFADDFRFEGKRTAVAKQIANSVPIPLGAAVAGSLAMQL